MKQMKFGLIGAASALAFATVAHAADPDLLVFDWAGWEIPGLSASYTEKYGQAPSYAFFADDDEAFQKISSGFKADVVHPCSQMVPKYRAAGLIEPWDTSRIPEFANLAPRMLASKDFVDDEGVWFIPTDYAFTAIAYNTDTVPAEDVASLKVFLDPKYAGRISLPDNTDDVWALALLATGVTDWTNVTDEQFEAAVGPYRAKTDSVHFPHAQPLPLDAPLAALPMMIPAVDMVLMAKEVRPHIVPAPARQPFL